jgi:outer membrane protein assembly factor BamB
VARKGGDAVARAGDSAGVTTAGSRADATTAGGVATRLHTLEGMSPNDPLAAEIEELSALDTATLRKRWTDLFGLEPAPRISRDLLIRGVAYRLQEDADRGLRKPALCQLARAAKELRETGSVTLSSGVGIKAGTKLIREWKGRVHEVVVLDDTYRWMGKPYRSLSQIARAITGTRWSGPRFFGLETTGSGRTAARADAAVISAGAANV